MCFHLRVSRQPGVGGCDRVGSVGVVSRWFVFVSGFFNKLRRLSDQALLGYFNFELHRLLGSGVFGWDTERRMAPTTIVA